MLKKYVKSAKVLEANKGEAKLEVVIDLDLLAKDLATSLTQSLEWCAGETRKVAQNIGSLMAALPEDFWKGKQALEGLKEQGVGSVPLTESAIKAYLDEAIGYWRDQRDQEGEGKVAAPYYIDAFQGIRKALFGEMKE